MDSNDSNIANNVVLNNINNEYEALQSHSSSSHKGESLVLHELPWCDLPLSSFIVNNPSSKIEQAKHIYRKYIVQNAYYTLNISMETYDIITDHLKECEMMEEQNKKENQNKDAIIDTVNNRNKIDKEIVTIFDVALDEINNILQGIFDRFKQSPT